MRRVLITTLTALALFAGSATVATPAFSGTSTVTTAVTSTVESQATGQIVMPLAWERHSEHPSQLSCMVNGASGQVRGQWTKWECYYSDYVLRWVLYVLK